jgi:hypothetical protein
VYVKRDGHVAGWIPKPDRETTIVAKGKPQIAHELPPVMLEPAAATAKAA